MTTGVNGTSPTTTSAASQSTSDNFRASDTLQDGQFKLDFENNDVAKSYKAFIGGMGETSAKSVTSRVENKMTDWVKAHPGADKAAFDKQLKSTLMNESMAHNILKSSIQKMMSDIENKMKEMAADRFG